MHQQLNTDQAKATQRERLTQLTAPVAGTVQRLAAIKFETFPYTKYGTVPASVKFVSADGLQDEKRGFTYEPNIFPLKGAVHHAGRTMPVVMDIDKPRIVLFANVLSKEEYEQLIAFSQPKMQQSVLRNEASTEMEVSKARTSEGAYLKLGETTLIQTIEERISALINWPVDKGEGMQALHYQTSAEYRPHFDFFTPELAGSKINMKRGGQRVSTLIMYLNDVEDGGETIFPKQNIKIKAVQGNALYFSYTNSKNELDRNTLHGGAPVLKGDKWIMTKWLRQDKI